jgi:hypothetical protein
MQRDLLADISGGPEQQGPIHIDLASFGSVDCSDQRPHSHCSCRGRGHEAEGAAGLVLPGAEQQGRILNPGGAWEGRQARQAHHAGKTRLFSVPFLWDLKGKWADTNSRFVSLKALDPRTFLKRLQSVGRFFAYEALLKCELGFRGVALATQHRVPLQNSLLAENLFFSALSLSLTSLISDGCVGVDNRSI